MKKLITRILLSSCMILLGNLAIAQNFLWGRSGGSAETTSGSDDETVKDMVVDRNGNIYILAEVKKTNLQIAGQPLTGYGWTDVMLASFTSKGSFRWVKMFGNGDADYAHWLGTDGKDGIYVSAGLDKSNNAANIDKDATSPKNCQVNTLIKYDTSGKFQWYRHPEMDTFQFAAIRSNVGTLAMDVGPSGTVYWLMQLIPGGYGGGAISIKDTANYILKYSSSGALSIIKPDLKFTGVAGANVSMTIDETNNRFYVSGFNAYNNGDTWMSGNKLASTACYIGCYKLDGSYLWHKEGNNGYGNFYSRVAIDALGNIYQAGLGKGASPSGDPAFVFNGYTVSTGSNSSAPLIIKMDMNGKLLWAKAGKAGTASGAVAVAIRNKDEVILLGDFNKKMEWAGYAGSLTTSSYDVFITRFQTWNGDVIGMDKIESDAGFYDYPRCMIADGKGNVYIGGEFTEKMFVNYKDTLVNNIGGGNTDWFLIKYGDMWPASVASNNSSRLRLYPNPTNGRFTFDGLPLGSTITVSNMVGQQQKLVSSNREANTFDIGGLPTGSYIIQVTADDGNRSVFKIEKL